MDYEKFLNKLVGLDIHPLCVAADMLVVHFGPVRKIINRRGEKIEVGEWALNIQCPWRFAKDDKLILARWRFIL